MVIAALLTTGVDLSESSLIHARKHAHDANVTTVTYVQGTYTGYLVSYASFIMLSIIIKPKLCLIDCHRFFAYHHHSLLLLFSLSYSTSLC